MLVHTFPNDPETPVHTFPLCCGAGVLILEHLTGKGEEADLELIKSWVYYARRNGYRMYDFPEHYNGKRGDPMSSKAIMGDSTDLQAWNTHNSWGMLLAITNPGREEIGERLKDFGFKELLKTHNPVYSSRSHKITLWGLDLNDFKEADLKPKTQGAKK